MSMNPEERLHDPEWQRAVAEASVWIATLNGPERTSAVEQGLRLWLEESAQHKRAYEVVTGTWRQYRPQVTRRQHPVAPGRHQWAHTFGLHTKLARTCWAVLGICLVAICGSLYFYHPSRTLLIAVGEPRVVQLEDGTVVILNVGSWLNVAFTERERRVRLTSGEALFDVIKDVERPFIVAAGDREVTAVGTKFLVNKQQGGIAITLIDGRIKVSPPPEHAAVATHAEDIPLSPGERVTIRHDSSISTDRPDLESLIAWVGGLRMNDLPLSAAIEMMNRYSTRQLEVDSRSASNIRVSGIFRVGESHKFAIAVARLNALEVKVEADRIILTDAPSPPLPADTAVDTHR